MKELELIENIKKAISYSQLKIFPANLQDFLGKLGQLDFSTLKTLYLFILSEDKDMINLLSYFLETAKNGNFPFESYLADQKIEKIYKKANRVRREIHRMKGLLRFREICGGYLYAPFRPENNIILPLAGYFSNRLRNEKSLIHDINRNIVAFCYRGKVYPAKIEREIPSKTEEEKIFSKLWLQYFDTISIKERLNLKIQKQKVSLKYRNSVIEFNGENL